MEKKRDEGEGGRVWCLDYWGLERVAGRSVKGFTVGAFSGGWMESFGLGFG